MSIPRKTIFVMVGAAINATPGAYTDALPSSVDEAYPNENIMDVILNAEAFLIHRIGESKYNGHRATPFMVDLAPSNGDTLDHHIGPVVSVTIDGLPATAAPAATVANLRSRNSLGLKLAGRLYSLEDNRIWFTGTVAAVRVFQFTRPSFDTFEEFIASSSDMPDEYIQAWVDMAAGFILSREGQDIQSAATFRNWANGVAVTELQQEAKLKSVTLDSQLVGE